MDLLDKVKAVLKKQLGHEPTIDELLRELNGMGLVIIMEKIKAQKIE